MQTIISCSGFEAVATANGIDIHEKKNNALKFGIVAAVIGILFFGISFIDLSEAVPSIIYHLFFYVFRWGGILLLVIGLITALAKGFLMKPQVISFDNVQRLLHVRGKAIPYTEIDRFTMQVQDLLGKKMCIILFEQQGKKKGFIPGSILANDVSEMERFVGLLNDTIRK